MREFDLHSLYGNISGYIGFFLGYSLFQIPNCLLVLIQVLKKALLRLAKRRLAHADEETTTNVEGQFIEQKKQRNIEQELKNFNRELYQLSQKFQELHDRIRQ